MFSSHRIRQRAFTLVELLVAIAILGFLVALLLPAVQAARAAARRAQCLSNVRQLGIALQNYHNARSAFPAAHDQNFWSWITQLLPHVEEANLYDQFDFGQYAFPAGVNQPFVTAILPVLLCPSDPASHEVSRFVPGGFAYTNYLGVAGTQGGIPPAEYRADGMFPSGLEYRSNAPAIALRKVTDGTSKTFFIGERPVIQTEIPDFIGDVGWWAAGTGHRWLPFGRGDNILDSSEGLRAGIGDGYTIDDGFHWWSYHAGGAHYVYVDASARLLAYDIDHNLELALSSRNGDEPILSRK